MTLSNYTQNAQKYLDNTPIIRGINGTELVDLVLKYYDQLSVKYRKMIPLKMLNMQKLWNWKRRWMKSRITWRWNLRQNISA